MARKIITAIPVILNLWILSAQEKYNISGTITGERTGKFEGCIFIETLDKNAAKFYTNLDEQLHAILNPFVEPVFIETKIEGAIGVSGSAALSDSVLFVYSHDNP